MASKRPKVIDIMGVLFTIEYIHDLKADDGEECAGLTVGCDRKISISAKVSSDQDILEATLCHEFVHAVLYASGLTNHLSDELEESLCAALEHAIPLVYKRR